MYPAGALVSLTFLNTVIAENVTTSGSSFGGGIYARDIDLLTFINCTVANNSSNYGGGLNLGGASGSDTSITNCIFWGNVAPVGQGPQIYLSSATTTVDYSDVAGGEGDIDGAGGLDWGAHNLEGDEQTSNPDFVAPAPPGNFRVEPTSPVIDMGDNDAVPLDVLDVDGDYDFTEPSPDLDLNYRFIGGPDNEFDCALVDMGAYEYTTTECSECADADACTHDFCREEDLLCENLCIERNFADIVPSFCPGVCPQPDMDDILCLLDDFRDGPAVNGCGHNWFSTDLQPCGGDGDIDLFDIRWMRHAFEQFFHCDDCTCEPCEEGAAPGGGGGPEGDRSAEAGGVLLIFLTTRAPVDGPYEGRFAQAVNVLTDWAAGQMSGPERAILAQQLQDPSQEFASPVAKAMVPDIVARLLDE